MNKMARASFVFLVAIVCATPAFAIFDGYIVTSVDLDAPYGTQMTSRGSAVYYDYWGNQASASLTGLHAIRGDDGSNPGAQTISSSNGQWAGTLSGIYGTAGVCFRANVDASANGVSQGSGSSQVCYAPPPPPPPPPPPIIVYDDTGCPQYQNCNSPIVLNVGNGGYSLSSTNDPVGFDLNADGTVEHISWTAEGAPMAFLALDLNGNGSIDDGAELFGNHTYFGQGLQLQMVSSRLLNMTRLVMA